MIPTNSLSLYHTNINSLPKKFLVLQELLKRFPRSPDIISISENRLDQHSNPRSFALQGYQHHHQTAISTYWREDLHVTLQDLDIQNAAAITIHIHANKQKTNPIHTIINLYRPPHHDPDFITNLQTAMDTIITTSPTTTITIQGDININLLTLTPAHRFTHFLTENSLHTVITKPTRLDPFHGTSSLIDMILTQSTAQITAGTISPPLSDHLAIYAIIHNPPARQTTDRTKSLSRRQYRRNKLKILSAIQKEITDALHPPPNTTAQHFQAIQGAMTRVIEQHERPPSRSKHKAWCKSSFRRQIRKQHKLNQLRQTNPTPQNIRQHAYYRNHLNRIITKAKKQKLAQRLSNERDPKRRMKILHTVIPRKSANRTSPTVLEYEGHTYTDPNDIADALNQHYITIGHKTTQKIPPQNSTQDTPIDPPHPTFSLRHITAAELVETMQQINRNKTNDIFKIKPTILRDLTVFLAPTLLTLFNNAIDEHAYPDPLKVTKVIEIYKAKDRTQPANYRPISLLPIIAKLLDTLINNQIMTHLTEHNIITPTQYAFRPNSGTTMALQSVINTTHKHRHRRKPTLAIYIDLSKAYDTIKHERLLHKLEHDFSFTPNSVAFFRSYFHNRVQSTHTQHAQSKPLTITHGIPQGSTLSTTFFLLYINDITRVVDSPVYTYADDTTLIVTTEDVSTLQTRSQDQLTRTINYFYRNNLVPNPTKTNYSIFYPIDPAPLTLTIQETHLKHNHSAPLLGITLQNNLKHHQTVNNIIRKLQQTIRCFRYANKLLPTKIMLELYYSQVYPHLIGNISIWGSHNPRKSYLQPLIRTQKKIIRLIANKPPLTHTAPIMQQLKILNLTNLYIARVSSEMRPFIHHRGQLNRPDHDHRYVWATQVHEYPTRHALSHQYYVPNPRTHLFSHNKTPSIESAHLHTAYARVWNTLPQKIRDEQSKAKFKTMLKTHLLEAQ